MRAPLTLLLLDGHPVVRQTLANRLRRHPGVEHVIAAESLPDALRLIAQFKPQLVVCDPRSLELDANSCVRQLSDTGLPVLVLTSSTRNGEAASLRRDGAADVLLKGVGISGILRSIDQALHDRAPADTARVAGPEEACAGGSRPAW